MRAATVVQQLCKSCMTCFYVLLHVLVYLWSLLNWSVNASAALGTSGRHTVTPLPCRGCRHVHACHTAARQTRGQLPDCPTICRPTGACATTGLSATCRWGIASATGGEGRSGRARLDCGVDDDDDGNGDILNHSLPAWRNSRSRKCRRHLRLLHICTSAWPRCSSLAHIYAAVLRYVVQHPHTFTAAAAAAHAAINTVGCLTRDIRLDHLAPIDCSQTTDQHRPHNLWQLEYIFFLYIYVCVHLYDFYIT